MPDVQMPDGTIIEDVPEGTTQSELMRRLEKSGPSAGGTFGRAFATQVANNALGLPDMLLTAGSRMALGQPLVDIYGQGDAPPEQQALMGRPFDLPEVGDRVLPIPRVPEMPEEQRAEFPKSAFGGEIAGDIFTILSGRAGARNVASRAPSAPARTGREMVPYIEQGVVKQLDTIANSVLKTHLPRGVARAAETGFEAATLAALQNADPVESAAYGAGIQAGGSMIQTLAKPLVRKGGLANAVILGYIGLQAAQNFIPGGNADTLNTISTAVTKTAGMFMLGALAAGAGTSRISGSMAKNLPMLSDAITTIPRTTWVSLVNDLVEDETGNTRRVVEQFAQNPEQFGPGAMVRIQRAMENGTLGAEVESLMEVPEFARKVMANEQLSEDLSRMRGAEVQGR